MTVQPIPNGYRAVTPYLVVQDVAKMLDFLTAAFDGTVVEQIEAPNGRIMHAEMRIFDSMLMMGGANENFPALTAAIYLYVTDTDSVYEQALKAGGESLMEPADQFYGDRNAGIKDPCGNLWWIATHVEDVPKEEIARRAQQM